MTRLWVVLLPALLLTAFWDNLGIAITHSPFYSGELVTAYNSGPEFDPSRYDARTFLGNLTFLQTIAVPTFGSNGPLWSLANEFWYYLIFPLVFCSIVSSVHLVVRLGYAVFAVAICYMMPESLLIYGLMWLLGVAVFVLHTKITLARSRRVIWLLISGALLATALTFSRLSIFGIGDFSIGLAFAAMLLPLSQIRQAGSIATYLSRIGAQFSYTLYLVHFPFAAFLACYLLNNRRLMPSLLAGWIFVGLLVIVVLYSYGVYLLFERNTPAARRAVWKIVRHRGLGDATTT